MNEPLKLTLEEAKLDDVLTVIFFYVDEFYQQVSHFVERTGPTPTFSDSEVITLTLVNQMVIDSETAWYKFVKRKHKALFPHLIERSRYHRRSKSLFKLTNLIRQLLLLHLEVDLQHGHLIDSMPVPVCGYTRAGRTHQFAAEFGVSHDALYGYCAAEELHFYGFRLHMLVTTQGIIAHFVLAPGSHHDLTVATELLETYRPGILIGADKGYTGLAKRLTHPADYQLIVPSKANQAPNTGQEKAFLACLRQLIETTNAQLSEQFNVGYSRAKSAWGLMSRLIHKLTAHTLAIYLNALADRPLLAIKSITF